MTTVLALLIAATLPLRNPFWPIGYTGEREIISDEPRIQVKPQAETPAADADTQTSGKAAELAAASEAEGDNYTGRLWIAARKTLRIGGTLSLDGDTKRQAVTINGRIYCDGDFISVNHDTRRFTWRVKGLTDSGTLKLQRIRYRVLEQTEDKGQDK